MADGPLLEVACDESGYEGEKLIATTTDVFAHASIALDADSAAAVIAELRRRIRSPAVEYKANHLLREKNRSALEWLLDPHGPLHAHAHVHLVDKAMFVLARLVELLLTSPYPTGSRSPRITIATASPAVEPVTLLYRDHQRAFAPPSWEAFLVAANDLMRVNARADDPSIVGAFLRAVEALRRDGASGRAEELLAALAGAGAQAERLRAELAADPRGASLVDPLLSAVIRAVAHWGQGGEPVGIVHDRQRTLSKLRVHELLEVGGARRPAAITLVGSLSDPRVQVADFLAGVARKIASDELNGRGDRQLTNLLRGYVDASSVWAADRGWAHLSPPDDTAH